MVRTMWNRTCISVLLVAIPTLWRILYNSHKMLFLDRIRLQKVMMFNYELDSLNAYTFQLVVGGLHVCQVLLSTARHSNHRTQQPLVHTSLH